MTQQLASDIREMNLSYLMLAQSMIRTDKAQALFRLGISETVADVLERMSPQQLVRVAARNQTVCSFRFDDELVWGLLTERHAPEHATSSASRLHASVLMAAAPVQAAA